MAINLNLEKYGAQFNAFVDFANANSNDEDTLRALAAARCWILTGSPGRLSQRTTAT